MEFIIYIIFVTSIVYVVNRNSKPRPQERGLIVTVVMWAFFWPFLIFYYPIKYIMFSLLKKQDSEPIQTEDTVNDVIDKAIDEREKTRMYLEKRAQEQENRRLNRENKGKRSSDDIENENNEDSSHKKTLKKLQVYIDMALTDGIVSEKELSVLQRKAKGLGIQEDELEMILESQMTTKRRICLGCGARIIDSSKVCKYCGT